MTVKILIGALVAMICWTCVVLFRMPLEALLDWLRSVWTGKDE